jgi:hypothetical protein
MVGEEVFGEENEEAVFSGLRCNHEAAKASQRDSHLRAGFSKDPPFDSVGVALVLRAFGPNSIEDPLVSGGADARRIV